MWIVRLKLNQNCIIANRCKKFDVVSYSLPLSSWRKGIYYYTSHRHTIVGDKGKVDKCIRDLKNDKEVVEIDVQKNTIVVLQKRKTGELITTNYDSEMFLVKPVYSDRTGTKYCEFASWNKSVLMKFVDKMKQTNGENISLEKFQKVSLNDVYFPKIMPDLSGKQAEAFQLAVEQGYFAYPRKVNLNFLAKKMSISVSTYQEHLRKAQGKLFPSYY